MPGVIPRGVHVFERPVTLEATIDSIPDLTANISTPAVLVVVHAMLCGVFCSQICALDGLVIVMR